MWQITLDYLLRSIPWVGVGIFMSAFFIIEFFIVRAVTMRIRKRRIAEDLDALSEKEIEMRDKRIYDLQNENTNLIHTNEKYEAMIRGVHAAISAETHV